jgi:transcriptional activator HAC1
MESDFSTIALDHDDFFPPQATVSLAETNLVVPHSPDSAGSVKDEDVKKPTKKRKSWGQELPTPKTNLPPRSAPPE